MGVFRCQVVGECQPQLANLDHKVMVDQRPCHKQQLRILGTKNRMRNQQWLRPRVKQEVRAEEALLHNRLLQTRGTLNQTALMFHYQRAAPLSGQ